MFEPGQKVICVDGKFPEWIHVFLDSLPIEGETYTVRDLVPGTGWNLKEEPAVYLVEIVNPLNKAGIERGFACRRFVEPEEVMEEVEEPEYAAA